MEAAAWAVPARPGGPCVHLAHAGCRQARRARAGAARRAPRPPAAPHQVEVVVPVHNEATTIADTVRALRHSLDQSFPYRTVVTVADTGSTDGTRQIAQHLAATIPGVHALLLCREDGAHALRMALASSRADVVACLDAASPTSAARLSSVVGSVLSGIGELAVATRPAEPDGASGADVAARAGGLPARVRRQLARLHTRSRVGRVGGFDGGTTAIRRSRALEILPLIEDDGRSLSAELVVAAARRGLRVTEIPSER